MNVTATAPRLTPQQAEAYHREGYLIFNQQLFSGERFAGLKNYFEQLLADLSPEVRPEAMDVPHFIYPKLHDWLLSDEVLSLVEPLIGPDIALFSSHFICKPRGNGKRVPWHEDSAYWKDRIDPMEVVTVWLAIDPSTKVNGCMKVIPRTHATGSRGYSTYEDVDLARSVFATEIVKSQRDESRAVHVELQAGECSLHDARIMHGSDANTSDIRRCGYTMRYMSTRCRFNHEKHGNAHKIFLAKGRDLSGNVYGDPGKSYADIAQYRSKSGQNSH